MISSAVETYVRFTEIALTIALIADIALGIVVHKKHTVAKPIYPSPEKNPILTALAIRAILYFFMMWALLDRNLGASDLGCIAVAYIGILLKAFYDVKYGSRHDDESGAL